MNQYILLKCNGNYNAVDDLSMLNVKIINTITRMKEVKISVKHISSYCKCKFTSTTCNLN